LGCSRTSSGSYFAMGDDFSAMDDAAPKSCAAIWLRNSSSR
jgi:hypothetical protein